MAKAAKKKAAPPKAAAKKPALKLAKPALAAKQPSSAALESKIARLEHELGILQDKNAIKELHFKYGYYIDKCLYNEVVDLFATDSVQRFSNGIYRGKDGARRLYVNWFQKLFTGGHNGPVYGFLLEHHIMQDIVDVAPDRKTAKLRARNFMMGGIHATKKDPIVGVPDQFWEGGIYENEYVKEDGVWKIKLLNYNTIWQAAYEKGWKNDSVHIPPLTQTYPEDPNGPDELTDEMPYEWPKTRIIPFHYPHPVTGKMWRGQVKGKGK